MSQSLWKAWFPRLWEAEPVPVPKPEDAPGPDLNSVVEEFPEASSLEDIALDDEDWDGPDPEADLLEETRSMLPSYGVEPRYPITTFALTSWD